MKPDGTDVRQQTRFHTVCTYGSFSPDMKHIVYRKVIDGPAFQWDLSTIGRNSEVFVANADGSSEVNLSKNAAFDGWPAWSADGKRVAFKKLISRNNWRLTVLDLATLQETPLAETVSVDDQAEWFDNQRVLYAIVDGAAWMSIMVVPSDGSGQPQLFAKGATSPAIVR